MKQITPIVLPNNLGTLETLRASLTINSFNENTKVNVRYVLGSLIDFKVQNTGTLSMTFDVYQTLATTEDALLIWVAQELGVELINLESVSIPKTDAPSV
jgi:hypothetical protein